MSKSRSGAPKRLAAGLLAGALTVVGLAFAPSAGATADVKTDRYAGTTRYGTAAAIAGQNDFKGATTAILATGENFPDALAASGVAGANTPAPIVLTQSKTYTKEAHDALNTFTNVTKVMIVGGTAAVSTDVENAVKADGFTVTRLAGTNRFGTAAAIAGAAGTIGQVGGKTTALIANGLNYPDALAGGTVAYAAHLPILLVTPSTIPAETSKALADNHIQHAIILGGTAAVSDAVKTQLDTATGSTSDRVAGTTRFGTAAAVGEWAKTNLNWAPTEIELASGVNFPDALAGGPLGGLRHAPILLLASVPDETKKFATDHGGSITNVNCLGGTAPCKEADLQAVATATKGATGPTNATATSRPELVSASIKTITSAFATTARPAGTYITYCFDEAITGGSPNPDYFFVFAANGDDFTADGVAPANGVTSADNKCVEESFGTNGDLDTAAEAATLTLATVDQDDAGSAVRDQGGNANIEGDAALTPAGATTAPAAAGVTDAPDLTAVGNFRAGADATHTAVDFTFDEAAYSTGNGSYNLVLINGDTITCVGPTEDATTEVSGGTQPGGEGTTVHTVTCDETTVGDEPQGTHFASADVARGYVDAGTVADAADESVSSAHSNPLEAADVSNGGNSDGPDLASVIFSPDGAANSDIVAFVFDENLATPGPGEVYFNTSDFAIYDASGTENPAPFNASQACVRSTDNNAVVLCAYDDGTLSSATYVGGNVRDGAVTDLQGIAGGGDEVAATPSAGPTRTSGKTDGPDLTGVKLNEVPSPLGGPTTYTATYTFDEDTADTMEGPDSGLHLYLADGIQLDCTDISGPTTTDDQALANRTEDLDNTVTCTAFEVHNGAAATPAQVHSAVVGTVDFDTVIDESTSGADSNPEGAELTTGTSGTPAT